MGNNDTGIKRLQLIEARWEEPAAMETIFRLGAPTPISPHADLTVFERLRRKFWRPLCPHEPEMEQQPQALEVNEWIAPSWDVPIRHQ